MRPQGRVRTTPRIARVKAPTWFDLVLGLVCVGLGVVLPLSRGADPATVLVTAGGATVLGAAVCFLPDRLRPFGWLGALLAGALVGSIVVAEDDWIIVWLFTYFLGVLIGMALLYRQRHGQRSSAVEEAGAGVGTESLVHLRWDEGENTSQMTEPEATDLDALIRALDGRQRGYVSILRGAGRLDVAGRADGAVMVYQCDDHADHRATWHHVTSPEAADGEDEITVEAGGVTGHFPRKSATTVDVALRAARHYLETGERDPGLSWFGSREVADMRHPIPD